MATYQKRGGKPKTKKEKIDKVEQDSTTAEVFKTLDTTASKTEQVVSKYQNVILGIIGVIVVAVLGYMAYDKFMVQPKQLEASNELSQSQIYFDLALEANTTEERDSLYMLAIEGANGKFGFKDIAKEYSSTKAGDLANYYAGISYLNAGKYQEAITYLEAFSTDDEVIGTLAIGAIGDAFLQLEQEEEALEYFVKAANRRDNDFTTPKYLFKAALTAIELNKVAEAVEYLEKIESEYPDSDQAGKLAPYLGKAKAMKS